MYLHMAWEEWIWHDKNQPCKVLSYDLKVPSYDQTVPSYDTQCPHMITQFPHMTHNVLIKSHSSLIWHTVPSHGMRRMKMAWQEPIMHVSLIAKIIHFMTTSMACKTPYVCVYFFKTHVYIPWQLWIWHGMNQMCICLI